MESNNSRELAVHLRFQCFPAWPDGLSLAACLRCGAALDVHQPDAHVPGRMLATCDACESWHLIDCDPETDPVVVVLLPDARPFREALRA